MAALKPRCTCGGTDSHSITCMVTVATQPHAMVNDRGEVFYPDNPEDAASFAAGHGAYFVNENAARRLRRLWRQWRQRRACFHHDRRTGDSWITSRLVDLGRRKLFRCTSCGKVWIV